MPSVSVGRVRLTYGGPRAQQVQQPAVLKASPQRNRKLTIHGILWKAMLFGISCQIQTHLAPSLWSDALRVVSNAIHLVLISVGWRQSASSPSTYPLCCITTRGLSPYPKKKSWLQPLPQAHSLSNTEYTQGQKIVWRCETEVPLPLEMNFFNVQVASRYFWRPCWGVVPCSCLSFPLLKLRSEITRISSKMLCPYGKLGFPASRQFI